MAKKKWIQKAVKRMKKKGTIGSFRRYCGGKVTRACIERAKRSKDPRIRKKAIFAENVRKRAMGGFLSEDDLNVVDELFFKYGGCIECLNEDIDRIESFQNGGELSTISQTVPSAISAIPAVGQLLSALATGIIDKSKSVRDYRNSVNQVTMYGGGGTIGGGRQDAIAIKGASHEGGGVSVDKRGMPYSGSSPYHKLTPFEVEGGEYIVNVNGKKYVFSKRLKV